MSMSYSDEKNDKITNNINHLPFNICKMTPQLKEELNNKTEDNIKNEILQDLTTNISTYYDI